MKGKKICISKSVGIFALVMIILIGLVVGMSKISTQPTSINTRATAAPECVYSTDNCNGTCTGGVCTQGGCNNDMYQCMMPKNISPTSVKTTVTRFTYTDKYSQYQNDIDSCNKNGGAYYGTCGACASTGNSEEKACMVYPIGSTPETLTSMKICKEFGYQWYAHCGKCAASGKKVNDVCINNKIGDLISTTDPFANKYTDSDSCTSEEARKAGAAWYSSGFENDNPKEYYHECSVCAKAGQANSVVCVIPPKGSKPASLFSQDVCEAFGFQWYGRCNKCGDVGSGVNTICSDKQLGYIDPQFGDKYTTLQSCNKNGGAWYGGGAYDATGKGVICEACAKTGTPIMKVCTDTSVSLEPKNLMTEDACKVFSHQWFMYCKNNKINGMCGFVGQDANGPCTDKALPTNYDATYGKFTTLDTCDKNGGAWYGCQICAKKGLKDIVACTQNVKPSDYKTYEDCILGGYQYYSYCGSDQCGEKSTEPNFPCTEKKISYYDSTYGKYTNLIDCNKNGGAWYGVCNLCAKRGLDEKTEVCK